MLIAVLAAALALAEMGEKGAQNAYLTHHIAASDDWAFYQAKNVRATVWAAEAGMLANLPNAADAGPQAEIKRAKETEARLRDEPQGDGMKQLAERAQSREAARDEAFHRYHEFELVVGALQIAIVLASVAVVTRILALAVGAGVIGAIAAGFGLFVAPSEAPRLLRLALRERAEEGALPAFGTSVDAPTREGYIARPTAAPASVAGHMIAQVAELVDAQVSGTCGRKVVEVRVFSWAPCTMSSTQFMPGGTIHLHRHDLPEGLTLGPVVAVDTETMGLNPHRDRLCLVQLSAGDGHAHLVQLIPPALGGHGYDCPNLSRLLADPATVKLMHFARFDVAVLQHYLGITVAPVRCTKIAARLTRTFTDRHGLKDLCKELLGVDLSKQQQTSDWGAVELTAEQLAYAASDVLHLHALWAKLEALLIREGRRELAEACFGFLPARARLDLLGYEQPDIFAH